MTDTDLNSCNVAELRKLCICGPGNSLLDRNGDKFSKLCGYITFAAISPAIVFVQVDEGLLRVK